MPGKVLKKHVMKALLDLQDKYPQTVYSYQLEYPRNYPSITFELENNILDRTDVDSFEVDLQFLRIFYHPQKEIIFLRKSSNLSRKSIIASYNTETGNYADYIYDPPNSSTKGKTKKLRNQAKFLDTYLREALMPSSIRFILDL